MKRRPVYFWQQRMTVGELIEGLQNYLLKNPELKEAVILDVTAMDDKQSIADGSIVFDLYIPFTDESGTLTVPIQRVVNAQ